MTNLDPKRRTYIGNRRPDSNGAWKMAHAARSVCDVEMCFDTPAKGELMCRGHIRAAQQRKGLGK